jgi:uroporphyrinogen III methyltransferase/synthase
LQIVPGITAALAAGSYAGIPLTDRGLASAVALVTGHEESDKSGTSLDWDALARFPGTLVIYMGVTTADLWTAALLQAGKPPNTPAALIRRCSLPDQQTIRCRLDEVAQHLTPASKFRPPVIVIVGAVAALAEAGDEPAPLPLRGQTILVTRPSDQADALAGPLRDHGATVLVQPAIEIAAPLDWSPVDRAIESLPGFQLVVFCSHNGVEFFLNRLLERGRDMRSLAGAQLAVVGQKTAQSLGQFHLRADIVPPDFRGKSLADQLVPIARDKKVLIVRASRGRDGWADRLAAAGADITQVVAYSHRDVLQADPNILDLVQAGQVDWVTVTSSAIARSIAHLLGPSLRRVKIASLSPVTSATVRELGYEVAAEADPFTIESLMEAICSAAAGCQGH